MTSPRPFRFLPMAGFAAALVLLVPRPAPALFYSAARAVRAADAKLEAALQAKEEGRMPEARKAFEEAYNAYADIRQKHPDVQTEHVAQQQSECQKQLLAFFAADEAAGEAVKEEVLRGAAVEIEDSTDDLPQNQVHASLPEAAPRERPRPGLAAGAAPAAPESGPAVPPPSSASLEERVSFYLRSNRAAEAVLELDALVGDDPEKAPANYRLLLARALVASGNNVRAILLLDPLVREMPTDPGVLTLAAGAHFAHGNTYTALQYLDTLVQAHPRYADAYIDLAYTRFAMDPEANRDEAVVYYRHALSFGAVRDRKLEAELDIKVEP